MNGGAATPYTHPRAGPLHASPQLHLPPLRCRDNFSVNIGARMIFPHGIIKKQVNKKLSYGTSILLYSSICKVGCYE